MAIKDWGSKQLTSIFIKLYDNVSYLKMQLKGKLRNKSVSSTLEIKEVSFKRAWQCNTNNKKKNHEPAGLLYSWQSFLMWAVDPHRKQQRISSASLFLQCSPLCLTWSLESSVSFLSRRCSGLLSESFLCLDLGKNVPHYNIIIIQTCGYVVIKSDMCWVTPTSCAWGSPSWSGQSCRRCGSSGR